MTIAQLGSLGEFLGFFVILITLIYLAVQTRQATHAARQRSHSDVLVRRNELFKLQYTDPDFLQVLSKGMAGEQLTPLEAQGFTIYLVSFLSHLQDTYLQFKANLIDEDVWEAELKLGTVAFTQPGFRNWWAHGKQFLSPEFAEMFESAPTVNLVSYDSATNTWSRPDGALFGKDVST